MHVYYNRHSYNAPLPCLYLSCYAFSKSNFAQKSAEWTNKFKLFLFVEKIFVEFCFYSYENGFSLSYSCLRWLFFRPQYALHIHFICTDNIFYSSFFPSPLIFINKIVYFIFAFLQQQYLSAVFFVGFVCAFSVYTYHEITVFFSVKIIWYLNVYFDCLCVELTRCPCTFVIYSFWMQNMVI